MDERLIEIDNYLLDTVNSNLFNVFNSHVVLSRRVFFNFSEQEKPVFLSLLMSEKHLKTILANRHLFDRHFVSAAELLLVFYEQFTVEGYNRGE